MNTVDAVAQQLASSAFIYPLMLGLSAMDAFVIILPSEMVLAALSATALAVGSPNLALLAATAALGAHLGDLAVFSLGRALRFSPLLSRVNRIQSALEWSKRRLDRGAPLVIVVARYIPYGRILVNLSAGSSGFSFRRFVALSALGCSMWAVAYSALGAGLGAWLGERWWIAVVAAAALSLMVSVVLDRLVRRWAN